MATYKIVARQSSASEDPAAAERYQVVDDDGNEHCRNAGGAIEDTASFSGAVRRYCELTGEDPDTIDTYHSLEIDGVKQTPV